MMRRAEGHKPGGGPKGPPHYIIATIVAGAWSLHAADGKQTILGSKHNFAVGSTAEVRSSTEQRVCTFCHSPHLPKPAPALWSHEESAVAEYGPYTSTTLGSQVGQPGTADSSKLCLSCHDGTVALGNMADGASIPFVQGSQYRLPPSSPSNLYKGTNLAANHPFSFQSANTIETQAPPAKDPVRLDSTGRVQCTTCHDPHNEYIDPTVGKFLVEPNARSALCLTCHTKLGWSASSHRQPTNTAIDPLYTSAQGAHTGYVGVANNGCESCHRPHSAAVASRLLKAAEENVCYACHNGSVTSSGNIQTEFQSKRYMHPVSVTPSVHDASEGPRSTQFPLPEKSVGTPRHAECPDCHDPHSSNPSNAVPPAVKGTLLNVSGINAQGAEVAHVAFEYQVCFKCHGDSANKPQYQDRGNSGIGFGRNPMRQTEQFNPNAFNTRLEFFSLVSWHPVVNPRGLSGGGGGEVLSLRPAVIAFNGQPIPGRNLGPGSLIYCTDCHNSDTGRNLGWAGAPAGPHGSNIVHLLERNYEYNLPPGAPGGVMSPVPYSASSYALCDKCHDVNNSILADQSFKYHSKHVLSDGAACSVCHDPHGVLNGNVVNNSHLINFDLSIVGPSSSSVLRYDSTGPRTGTCYLTCHGKDHNPLSYK
jgi:predicted CXXCH cytochrome family protein